MPPQPSPSTYTAHTRQIKQTQEENRTLRTNISHVPGKQSCSLENKDEPLVTTFREKRRKNLLHNNKTTY